VQIIASVFLLVVLTIEEKNLTRIGAMCAMLLKIGNWPFQAWYLWIIEKIGIKIKSLFILTTWQKILPAVIVLSVTKNDNNINTLGVIALARVLAPIFKMSYDISIEKIIAMSSLNNNGWVLVTVIISLKTLLVFMIPYMITI